METSTSEVTPESDRMTELAPLPEVRLGLYRRCKGGEYEVAAVARHSESLEPLIGYRLLHADTGWWARPHAMFFEVIEVEGRAQPRFAYLRPA